LKGTEIMRFPRPWIATSVVTVAAVSLLAAGCGGGSSTPAATTTQNGALAFARCLRSHGLPNWPDPNSSGVFDKSKIRQLGYSESRVRAIEDGACNHLLPNGGSGGQTELALRQRTQAGLAFARCVRRRGFPNFPDPTSQGQLTPDMVTAAGIDLHQPALLTAGLACAPLTHGLITRAAVERAVNGG
jgi:hypothetical protein